MCNVLFDPDILKANEVFVPKLPTYVIVTPARNEAQYIEATMQAVVAQTERPMKWVIVSDGSTDGMDEIVARYAAQYDWIEMLRMPDRAERHFAGKVDAIHAGVARVSHLPYQVIACLDADIVLDKVHFSYLLGKMSADPMLGIVGVPFANESGETFDYKFVNIEHVSGACQVFRRECFEAIGGYVAAKVGTIDCIAVMTARMKGWKTRTFTDITSLHLRQVGTAQEGPLKAKWTFGVMDYAMGNHPLWQFFRVIYQMTKKPYVIGALMLGGGFLWSWICRRERTVSKDLMAFHRSEDMQRLKLALKL